MIDFILGVYQLLRMATDHWTVLDWTVFVMPWCLSVVTLYMTFMAGNKHPKAWLIGIFNQLFWLLWIYLSNSWGFLPMNIGMWVMYYRNHVKWNKEKTTA